MAEGRKGEVTRLVAGGRRTPPIRIVFRMESAADAAVRASLARFDDSLLRAVAAKLFKPRSQWPADELIDRAVEALSNAPVIDRRLKDLPDSARHLLAAIGLSRRTEWPVGQVVALLATIGHAEGLAPILAAL